MGLHNLYRKLAVLMAMLLIGFTLLAFHLRRNDSILKYYATSPSKHLTLAVTLQKAVSTLIQSAPKPKQASHAPKIVVWAKPYHPIDWTLSTLENGDGGCDLTFDRNEFATADAVVFFMKSCKPGDLPDPKKRRRDQAFVWWSHESPWTVRNYYHHKLTEYNNYFNWTMTFRMDSDVLAPMWPVPSMDYLLMKLGRTGEMVDKNLAEQPRLTEDEFQREVKHLMSRKSKFVSWIVSDCGITWGAKHRVKIAASLENEGQIPIDKFGKCAKKPIPLNMTVLFQTLSPYKFYLAFENALHCQDYLTEKTIYNSFVGGNVPVIFGPSKSNVTKILPRNSYIHVEDFKDMKEAGDYLRYLDKNDTAYMEYFQWWKEPGAQTFPRFGFNYGPKYWSEKSDYRHFEKDEIQDDSLELERFGFYHLCRKLKNGDHKKTFKIIPDLAKWWYGAETSECLGFRGKWQIVIMIVIVIMISFLGAKFFKRYLLTGFFQAASRLALSIIKKKQTDRTDVNAALRL